MSDFESEVIGFLIVTIVVVSLGIIIQIKQNKYK